MTKFMMCMRMFDMAWSMGRSRAYEDGQVDFACSEVI